jgi:hypothetical protein
MAGMAWSAMSWTGSDAMIAMDSTPPGVNMEIIRAARLAAN